MHTVGKANRHTYVPQSATKYTKQTKMTSRCPPSCPPIVLSGGGETSFDVAKHFDTVPELADRAFNRPRRETLETAQVCVTAAKSFFFVFNRRNGGTRRREKGRAPRKVEAEGGVRIVFLCFYRHELVDDSGVKAFCG